MAKHYFLIKYVIELLKEYKNLSTREIYDYCKKKYSRYTSTFVINNVLGKNKEFVKTGTVRVKRFNSGYSDCYTWSLRGDV